MQKTLIVIMLCWSGLAAALPQIEHWQTTNGARVYFVAAHELPMVDIRVVFDAGSARDTVPGVASLTAGLLAEGAGSLDADAIAERFDALGARFGANASRDNISVSLRSLTDPALLQPAVDTLALLLRAPSFPADAFERERNRTLVALRAQEQSPGALADRAFHQALYGEHPYARPTLGTTASVTALTRDDVLTHYRHYFMGRNAIVVIVGDLNRTAAEILSETVAGRLPPGSVPPPLPEVAPALGDTVHVAHPSSQTHILLGQPVLSRGDPDYFALYVGNHILGGSGLVSRISDEVREKRGLAYSAYSYFLPLRRPGPFQIGAQTKTASVTETLAVLRDTLERYLAVGPTPDELVAAQKNITGGFPLNIDSNSDIAGYLAMMAFYDLPLDYLDRFIERVNAVTVGQIHDAFRRRVDPTRLVTVTVGNGQ
ncbi:MAG: peptidase M16 [Gammaproteobacteria bacterium HGW-Gammaproteobacteria-1]|nr:MAG: peptidase M16 [Gammaproteobacteria bacterium HGW-Gammaproteobacteria-1]